MDKIKSPVKVKKLGKWQAAIMVFALTYGSPTLTSPFLVTLGGPWSYALIYLTIYLTLIYCGNIISRCSVIALSYYGENEMKLGALSKISKLAFGEKSVSFMVTFQLIVLLANYLGMLLISATIIADLLPIEGITKENMIRIGCVISTLVSIPFIFKSSLHELGLTTILSALAMLLSTLLIQIICFNISSSDVKLDITKYDLTDTTIAYRFFNIAGTLLYCIATPGYMLPPLVTSMNKPKELISASTLAFTGTLIASFFAAYIPYYFLPKDYIHPSLITTLVAYTAKSILYEVLKYLICIMLVFHFTVDFVCTIYPCFFLVQILLNITEEQIWKRNMMRLAMVLTMCCLSLIFISVRAVLSLIGGGPLVIYSVLIPICCYYKLSTSQFQPMLLYIVIGVFACFIIIGSVITDTQYLLANDN